MKRWMTVLAGAGLCALLVSALAAQSRGPGGQRPQRSRAQQRGEEGQRPQGQDDEGPPGGRRGRRPPPPGPVMRALDTDRDGELSAEEIAGAAEALLTLDKDGNGMLSHDELRPPPPPRDAEDGEGPPPPPPGDVDGPPPPPPQDE